MARSGNYMSKTEYPIAKPTTDELIKVNGYIRCSKEECDFLINGVPLKFPKDHVFMVGKLNIYGMPNDKSLINPEDC